jgi:ABC-type transport system involved in cytochrome c biogenesis ATPase subunit
MSASVHGLLDRECELGAIERALTVSHRGNGQVLVVEAEGGIGKTALLRLAADGGRAVGFRVLSAVRATRACTSSSARTSRTSS